VCSEYVGSNPCRCTVYLSQTFLRFFSAPRVQCHDCISESPHTFTSALQFFRHKPTTIDGTWAGMSTSSNTKLELRSGGTSTNNFTAVLVGTCRIILSQFLLPAKKKAPFLNHLFFLYHCSCRLCIRGYYLTSAE